MSFKDRDVHSQSKTIIYVYLFLKQLSEKEDLDSNLFKRNSRHYY